MLAERRVGGRDDLARPQHRQLIIQRLPPVRAERRRGELAGGQIEQGHAGAVGAGRDGQQEGWLAGLEVAGRAACRARTPGRPRASRSPSPGAGPPPAHRSRRGSPCGRASADTCPARDRRPHIGMAPPDASFDRGQRKLERPRRDQRILVEHFVEVAHPEEDDGAGILALRILVLAHRGRRGRACTRARGHAGFGGHHSSVSSGEDRPGRGGCRQAQSGRASGKYSSPCARGDFVRRGLQGTGRDHPRARYQHTRAALPCAGPGRSWGSTWAAPTCRMRAGCRARSSICCASAACRSATCRCTP